MPDLIRLVHKNPMGMNKIIKTFRIHWGVKISTPLSQDSPTPHSPPPGRIDHTPQSANRTTEYQEYENASKISKRQMEMKIQAIAVKEIRAPISRPAFYVHDLVLKQYGFEQENVVPLTPNGAPSLSAPSADYQTPTRIKPCVPAETPNQSKRKSKSLLDFLSKSPVNRSPQILTPSKRLKLDPPPPPNSSPAKQSLRNFLQILTPPKPMNPDPSKCAALNAKNCSSDVLILKEPPTSTSDGVTKPSKMPCLTNVSTSEGPACLMAASKVVPSEQPAKMPCLMAASNVIPTSERVTELPTSNIIPTSTSAEPSTKTPRLMAASNGICTSTCPEPPRLMAASNDVITNDVIVLEPPPSEEAITEPPTKRPCLMAASIGAISDGCDGGKRDEGCNATTMMQCS